MPDAFGKPDGWDRMTPGEQRAECERWIAVYEAKIEARGDGMMSARERTAALLSGKPIRIQRRRTKGWRMPQGAIYVGRPTPLGNPWQGVNERGRKAVVETYRGW